MLIGLVIALGATISIASGIFWRKYKLLHFLPWLYGFATYFLLPDIRGHVPYDLLHAMIPGFAYYAMAWASTLKTKGIIGKRSD